MSGLTNCKNCGAPLSRYSCKCEYCGTEYYDGISAGIMTVNEARSLFGLDQSRELDRIASIGLRAEFINQILSKC